MTVVADALIAHRLRESVLVENRLPALEQKWLNKLNTTHDPAFTANNSDAPHSLRRPTAFHTIVNGVDPTGNKQYSDRLLHWYHHGQYRLEDAGRVRGAISSFHANKHKLPEKDINRYQSIHDVERAVDALDEKPKYHWTKTTESQRHAVEHGSELVHDSPELSVRTVRTHAAMKVLGAHSKWCVVPDKSTWEEYDESGPMHFVHEKKTGNRYLLHLPTGQFMDEHDRPVDHHEFSEKHPDMVKLFHGQNYKMFTDKRRADADILSGRGDHYKPGFRYQVAEHTTNPHVLDALVDDDEITGPENKDIYEMPVHTAVPWNPHASPRALERLMKHAEHYHRYRNEDANIDSYDTIVNGVAQHPKAPPHLLQQIADKHMDASSPYDVLSANPNTPEPALRVVADDLRQRLKAYSRESEQDSPSHALISLAQHPNASPELLKHVLHSTGFVRSSTRNHVIKHAVASNKATDGDLLHYLSRIVAPNKDSWTDHAVHTKIAEHPNAQPRTLRRLHDLASQHKNDDRRWVADANRDTLDAIRRHPRFKEIDSVPDSEAWS